MNTVMTFIGLTQKIGLAIAFLVFIYSIYKIVTTTPFTTKITGKKDLKTVLGTDIVAISAMFVSAAAWNWLIHL